MRNNGPVTGREVSLSNSDDIVSATDTRGIITFCNDTFCEIAGYAHEELIGQPHNLLRHGDMPAAAFQMLWDAIKGGQPWMGIVKNRCKNGDHYWVDAYVTPLRDSSNTITGYSLNVDGSISLGKTFSTGRSPVDLAIIHHFLYNVNAADGTVSMYRIDSHGGLTDLGRIDGLPEDGAVGIAAR